MSYAGNRELAGHEFPADAHLDVVTFERNGHTCYGVRRSDDKSIATFGQLTGFTDSERDDYLADIMRRFRDAYGSLGWTETGDDTYPAVVLRPDGTAFTEDAALVEGERTAQATALATMRRREADALSNAQAATERAERAERRVAEAIEQRNAETDKLRELWRALAEQAEERQWCGEFEQFYENNNGEEYIDLNSEFDVVVRVSVPTRGIPANVESHQLRRAIYDLSDYDINIVDYNVVE